MKKLEIKPLIEASKKWFIDHAPGLMVGSGTVLLVSAVGVTAYSTVKAVRAVDKKKEDLGDNFRPVVDVIITGGKYYICPFLMTTGGTFLIKTGFKQQATILAGAIAAYALNSEKLDIYEQKAKEVLTKNKKQELDQAVVQEMSDRHPEPTQTIVVTDDSDTWFYDPVSNSEFKSSTVKVDEAVNKLNHILKCGSQPYASMNEFQHLLGIEMTENVDNLGWSSDTLLEMRYDVVQRHGKPFMTLIYNVKPYLDFDKSFDQRFHLKDLL